MKNFEKFYHVCIRKRDLGLICYLKSDYDQMVKSIAISAVRNKVAVVSYCVMSNHLHVLVSSKSDKPAKCFASSIIRCYAKTRSYIQVVTEKYNSLAKQTETRIKEIEFNKKNEFRRNTQISIKYIYGDSYLRNTIAYILKNEKDNSDGDVLSYPWNSASCMFTISRNSMPVRLSSLTYREMRKLLKVNIEDVMPTAKNWFFSPEGQLEPASFCDYRRAEAAFGSKEVFLNSISSVDTDYIWRHNVDYLTRRLTDYELYMEVDKMCKSILKKNLVQLTDRDKMYIATKVSESFKTSTAQVKRVLGLK